MNDFLAQGINADGKLKSRKILNMAATPYNVSSVASVTANANNINQAMHDASIFSDAAGVFLPGGPKIPSNGLILPSEPILFLGDGSGNSFIHFAANQQGLGYVNTVGSARWGDGFTYEPVWIIQGITFEGSYSGANWGWNFPNWSSPSGTALNMLARDVKVTYFAGGGINYQIGGIGPDGSFENIEVAHIGGDACFKLGSDFRGSNLDAHSADYEAYYWDNGRNTQLQLIKGWDVGKAHVAGRSAGMHMAGGGQTITNAYMQDCYGPSVYAVNCDGLTIGELVSDRNNWDATDGTSALVVENSHNIQIDNYRNIKTANTQTQYSLKVLDSGSNNYSNRISMVHDTNGGFSMTGAVDPASNTSVLSGFVVVRTDSRTVRRGLPTGRSQPAASAPMPSRDCEWLPSAGRNRWLPSCRRRRMTARGWWKPAGRIYRRRRSWRRQR
jgi:hypothetical protein